MEQELKDRLNNYFTRIKQRKEIIKNRFDAIKIKEIALSKINDDLNYVALFLLKEKGFEFDKERVAGNRLKDEGGVLKICKCRHKRFYAIDFISSWSIQINNECVLDILPMEFKDIVNNINEVYQKYIKEGVVPKKFPEKKINVVCDDVAYWSQEVRQEQVDYIKYDELSNPPNYIEDDNYYKLILEYLGEIEKEMIKYKIKYEETMDKINTQLDKFNYVLVGRDL